MAEKLKIAMLGHKRTPSREGGIEVVVEELSTRLAAMGHSVTCFNRRGNYVLDGSKVATDLKEYKGIKIKFVPTINRKGMAALTSSFFGSILCAFGNYDIVHYHAEGPCAFMWIPKLFKKKCIATVHGLDWAREKWKGTFAEKYIKYGERVAVKKADEIIVLSKSVQDYFRETYGRDTQFIPNGITKPEVLPAQMITEKFCLRKDNYILFLGRIVPEKGLRYLIGAFKQIGTDMKLVIAGGSSDTVGFFDEIKALATEDERIVFTGFVEGQTLSELYSNAYIYILPSDLEGMPISLLEAMSYGNCCLISSIPECTEVVEDKAVIFEKSNVEDLTAKLRGLLASPDTVDKYKTGATDYILKKYNWDEVVEKTTMLYGHKFESARGKESAD